MPAKRKLPIDPHALSTLAQVKKQMALDISAPATKPRQIILNLTEKGLEGLTYAARRYRTTKSHIADLVFCNLHKLRLVDIVEDTDDTPTGKDDPSETFGDENSPTTETQDDTD